MTKARVFEVKTEFPMVLHGKSMPLFPGEKFYQGSNGCVALGHEGSQETMDLELAEELEQLGYLQEITAEQKAA